MAARYNGATKRSRLKGADDAVCHCQSQAQAKVPMEQLCKRFVSAG